MMGKISEIHQIRIDLFKRIEQGIKLNDSIFLDDNLSGGQSLMSYGTIDDSPGIDKFPYKLSFDAAVIDVSGEMEVVINGRDYRLHDGDILIVQAGSIVESMTCSENMKNIAMAFSGTADEDAMQKATVHISSLLMSYPYPVEFHLGNDAMGVYMELYDSVKKNYMTAEESSRNEIVRGFIQISAASFMKYVKPLSVEQSAQGKLKRTNEIYMQFMNDLQRFAARERSVSFYAGRCCVCEKYFSKQIKSASGKIPMKHIKDRVILESKVLLASTNHSVKRISDELNFPNESFFCRYFKKETGFTPEEYRRMKK